MYGRHEVFEVYAQGIKNLQVAYPDVDIQCMIVGTGDKEIAEKHGFEYHEFPNKPLGAKAQHRLELCKNRADYYLFLGSDDIMDEHLFGYYLEQIKKGIDYISCYEIYYHNKGNIYHSKGYPRSSHRHGEPIAVGRCVSNSLLARHKWNLWSAKAKDRGLDGAVYKKLRKTNSKHFFRLNQSGGVLLDIKTSNNLTKLNFNHYDNVGKDKDFLNPNLIPLLNGL